jgi:hypothetical protein
MIGDEATAMWKLYDRVQRKLDSFFSTEKIFGVRLL